MKGVRVGANVFTRDGRQGVVWCAAPSAATWWVRLDHGGECEEIHSSKLYAMRSLIPAGGRVSR